IEEILKNEKIPVQLDYVLPKRPNVYAFLGGEFTKKPKLMLNGHVDTVPGFNMDYDAYKPFIKNGSIFGRGSCDMKGGIASFIAAIIAIKRSGIKLDDTVMFAGVIDEEECSRGTEHLVKNGFNPEYVLISEPTGMDLCTRHKGFEWMEVKMIGRSCHGSTPKEGKNAIYAASYFNQIIQEKLEPIIDSRFDKELGRGSVCVGKIEGGNDPNIVPDLCSVQLDRRWLPQESLESVHNEVIECAKIAAEKYGCKFEFRPLVELRASMVNAPYSLDVNDKFVTTMQDILSNVLKKNVEPTYFKGWSDAGILGNHSDAKCIILGPGNAEQAHANDEFCSLDEIYENSEVCFEAIRKLCRN
ncbi:M20 family metallopeptidase, partial [uncultured Clostridium sp.]|uniref:M20 family metallopeptidase n=1 Tax=uncultured Clostridium sp. TaxID=59620 RepID=UPI0025DD95E3